MSFMENQVLGYKSPLYGRRTAQFKLNPFTFQETRLITPFYFQKIGRWWGNNPKEKRQEEQQELVEDLVQIITVFSCKLQGEQANKAKKLVQELIREEETDVKSHKSNVSTK